MSLTVAFRSRMRGCSTCRRLNASSWPVSAAARSDARFGSPPRIGAAVGRAFRRSGTRCSPEIAVSRLLKSWAMPPASRPTASIFCACRSWPSMRATSVTLSNVTATPSSCSRKALTEKMLGPIRSSAYSICPASSTSPVSTTRSRRSTNDSRNVREDLRERAAHRPPRSGARSRPRSPCWRNAAAAIAVAAANT